MANYRRDTTAGGTWFFTVVTHDRRPFLCDPRTRVALRDTIAHVRANHPFTTCAWVLLPDHFHCMWTLPKGDANFSLRMSLIKRSVTRRCKAWALNGVEPSLSRSKHREAMVWQRRFWEHRIRDEADFRTHVDYIHFNPVKHGHCLAPADWPYSSLHRYIREGVFTAHWAVDPEQAGELIAEFGEG